MRPLQYLATALLLGLSTVPAEAQRVSPYVHSDEATAVQRPDTLTHYSDGRMAAAGLVGGVVGMAAGLGIGALLGELEDDCWEMCLGPLLVGFAIGESLGISTGVHLGNGAQGSWIATTVASVAAGAAGLLLAQSVDVGPLALAIPLGQIVASVSAQKASARWRHPPPPPD